MAFMPLCIHEGFLGGEFHLISLKLLFNFIDKILVQFSDFDLVHARVGSCQVSLEALFRVAKD